MRILIATETRLYRDGLAQTLRARTDAGAECFDVIAVAGSDEAVEELARNGADVFLLDMSVPDSLQLVALARELVPDLQVLALAVTETDADVVRCAAAGVAGYVPRECSLDELVAAIRCAGRGELLCSPRIAASLFRSVGAYARGHAAPSQPLLLTARELEISTLIQKGLGNKQIAHQLYIELPTVKNHVHNILEKLHVRRRGEIAAHIAGTARAWIPASTPNESFDPLTRARPRRPLADAANGNANARDPTR